MTIILYDSYKKILYLFFCKPIQGHCVGMFGTELGLFGTEVDMVKNQNVMILEELRLKKNSIPQIQDPVEDMEWSQAKDKEERAEPETGVQLEILYEMKQSGSKRESPQIESAPKRMFESELQRIIRIIRYSNS